MIGKGCISGLKWKRGVLRNTRTYQERHLGVTISKDLKPNYQFSEIVKVPNKLVSFTGRAFNFKSDTYIIFLTHASQSRILSTLWISKNKKKNKVE